MGLLLAIAILTSFYLTPAAMRLAWKYDAVSRPDGFRKKHSRPTPAWGGLAVNASILLGLATSYCLLPPSSGDVPFHAALAVSVVILGLLGCYDDLFDMRAGVKLAGQLLSVVPLVVVGVYVERFSVFGFTFELGCLGIPWTIAWIILGINAWNLIDGMDGLASTVGITVAAIVAVLAGLAGNTSVAVLAVVLAGALGGFLAHNLPPARVYLGDCGSMVIGLVLATLAFRVVPQPATPNLPVMIALLFVPLYDTVLAILRRGLNGRGIMTADREHVHHRLLDRGLSVWASLALLAALNLTAGVAGYFAMLTGQEFIAVAVLVAVATVCVQLDLFGRQEWTAVIGWLRSPRRSARLGASVPLPRKRPEAGVLFSTAHEIGTRRKQLEGLSRGKPGVSVGIDVRMAGAPRAHAATTGKEYVELLS